MRPSALTCVRHLVEQYRRYLRTGYRFLDPVLRDQFEAHLAQADVVVRGPYVTLSRDFLPGRPLAELVAARKAEPELTKANWVFGAGPLHRHQERALETGRAGRSFVVTTGTGSGKTESFLLAVLDGILRRKREGVRGVQAILLYPMNALANDQLERLRRLFRGGGLDVSFALYTGDSDTSSKNLREEPAETERVTRASIRSNPPDVLLTNYKQLEFMLVRKEDRGLFTPALRFLVLDELHSYRGSLATEIACLIRRLKAHAEVPPGKLVGIGTSATVSSDAGGAHALAEFATVLFGETFEARDVIGEEYAPRLLGEPYTPPAPRLTDDELVAVDEGGDAATIALSERLTGRRPARSGPIARRIAAMLSGNSVVAALEDAFMAPAPLSRAVEVLRERLPERANLPEDVLRREVEAYLLVGSVGAEDDPPRLRPKLHVFLHGVYDVSLCLNPSCRLLVPQGGAECPACGAAARPAALCRTCGQDFVKVRFESDESGLAIGTGDFYSDEKTAFLTPRILELPDARADDEEPTDGEDGSEDEELPTPRTRGAKKQPGRKKRSDGESKVKSVDLCTSCGRLVDGDACPACKRKPVPYLMVSKSLHSCPACGGIYTRGDIVTPLRTGTASTVSALATHHLDRLRGADRRLLVFADNRQDAAHQAGYTADKHRTFALRHAVADEVRSAGDGGIALLDLPERLFDRFRRDLGIIVGKPTQSEHKLWIDALTIELAQEITRYSRQRASLENLGLIGVEYEFLDDLARDADFCKLFATVGLDAGRALLVVRVVLDELRRNRAVGFSFFREWIDVAKKSHYRQLEAEPYNVRFPDQDRGPKGFARDRPAAIRKAQSGSILGFYQENEKAGNLTAIHKIVTRALGCDRHVARQFLHDLVPLLERAEVLEEAAGFPLSKVDKPQGLRILQIKPKVIRLVRPKSGFRCNACQTFRPYDFPTCPTSRCVEGRLQSASLDSENYYVGLYTEQKPQRFAVEEHSAQIPGDVRAQRETKFKEGKLDALVCTPTLELGVDIGPLLTVLLRNAPPTPANYVQRVGRAGRRLRIGFASTFCAGGAHDRHAFENPDWLIAGHFTPARVRLDNLRIVERHLRSFLLESLDAQLPQLMGDLLDDTKAPTHWSPEKIADLLGEVRDRAARLTDRLAALFAPDRSAARTSHYDRDECERIVGGFEAELNTVLERWWRRIQQLQREHAEYAQIGSPRHDRRKAAARQRAYYEITQDPERAYVLSYLSTQGLLPAYQFPLDTFSLDPGVEDTPTLHRPSAIALEEFAPGNFVYANGHKLKSIRVLYAGGPGARGAGATPARSDAEATGRLRAFQFCESCEEVVEETRNTCPRCARGLGSPVECVFVDSFEAEESLRIGSEEESRQRVYHDRRESLLTRPDEDVTLYPYPFAPMERRKLTDILVTNWGRADSKTGEGARFRLCPDCGRHQPYDPLEKAHRTKLDKWNEYHKRFCQGEPRELVLGYQFGTSALVLHLPSRGDRTTIGRSELSPTLVTLAEALLIGAGTLLEIETGELAAFPRHGPEGSETDEIVFYETVPGGAGYTEEVARRLPEVAEAAQRRLYGHVCRLGCYLCLKHYRNQRWHPFFDKERVRDVLFTLAAQARADGVSAVAGDGARNLRDQLSNRQSEVQGSGREPGVAGPQSPIEEKLLDALRAIPDLPAPVAQHEVRNPRGDLVTIPDFAYLKERIAVFCDGFAYHGNIQTLALDAKKRNWLQSKEGGEWLVLTYWGRTILNHPDRCARQIAALVQERSARH